VYYFSLFQYFVYWSIIVPTLIMVTFASILTESEVFITVLCSPRYTAAHINNCSKSTSVIKITTMKNMDGATHLTYHLKLKYPLRLCSTHFSNQELFEKHLCNQGRATMNNFCYAKVAITRNHQINTFLCQKRWMGHKGGLW